MTVARKVTTDNVSVTAYETCGEGIERTGVYQIQCKDPDGCGVELNFQNVKAA